MTQTADAVVIGGGQSGLAAAAVLAARGLSPVVFEAGGEPVGSWPRYYDSLALFSPARYTGLPGETFPVDPERYPSRDEVVDYLRSYAEKVPARIRTRCRVTQVESRDGVFGVYTDDNVTVTPIVVAATGVAGRPYTPELPGLGSFSGTLLHAADYREPTAYRGKRIVVVGAGNSAIQIAVELAEVADVTVASRTRVRLVPQRPLGRDMHFWYAFSGLDTAPVGPWLPRRPTAPVFDDGRYRAAFATGKPDRRSMFRGIEGDSVTWADGSTERVDVILCATGYRPDVGYLAGIGALDENGLPRHRAGVSTTHRGLGYVGLEWQRSLSSATIRGVSRDADYVAGKIMSQTVQSERV